MSTIEAFRKEIDNLSKAKVKVIAESKSGLNTRVSINGQTHTNNQAYSKAVKGNVPGYHGVKRSDGTKFIRSNPDGKFGNNLG